MPRTEKARQSMLHGVNLRVNPWFWVGSFSLVLGLVGASPDGSGGKGLEASWVWVWVWLSESICGQLGIVWVGQWHDVWSGLIYV